MKTSLKKASQGNGSNQAKMAALICLTIVVTTFSGCASKPGPLYFSPDRPVSKISQSLVWGKGRIEDRKGALEVPHAAFLQTHHPCKIMAIKRADGLEMFAGRSRWREMQQGMRGMGIAPNVSCVLPAGDYTVDVGFYDSEFVGVRNRTRTSVADRSIPLKMVEGKTYIISAKTTKGKGFFSSDTWEPVLTEAGHR